MQKGFIRNVLAGLMVLLFAFSITPKIMLHDLVADHKDRPYAVNDSNTKEIDASGFHCHYDNLVVESPFLADCFPIGAPQLPAHEQVFSLAANHFHFATHFYFALRAPPFTS
jgi:hypothetical protein